MVSPALYLIVAKGLTERKRRVKHVLLFLIILSSAVVNAQYYVIHDKPQWQEISQFIEQNSTPNDLILLNVPSRIIPFSYYFNGPNEVRGIKQLTDLRKIMNDNTNVDLWLIIITEAGIPLKDDLVQTYNVTHEQVYHTSDGTFYLFSPSKSINLYHFKQ